jgi:hypothetical protein
MKNTKLSLFLAAVMVASGFAPFAVRAEGHHQSGIVGTVPIVVVQVTMDGQVTPIPPHVRVFSQTGELIAEMEAEAEGFTAHFRFALKPGKYVVWAYYESDFTTYGDFVTVKEKQYTTVSLAWESCW